MTDREMPGEPLEDEPFEPWPGRVWPMASMLAVLCAIGFAVRFRATSLPLFLDEAATLLAAQQIGKSGLPILPSGVLYLHGATVSYLLAPLGHWGLLDIANVEKLRLLNVIIGTVAIPLAYLIGKRASGSAVVGLFAALLVAIDPVSALWGTYLRMYAMLETTSALFVLAFLSVAMVSPREVRSGWLVALVVAYWLAVFSHLTGALLLPAAALTAIGLFGRELLGPRRGLTVALAGCLLGLVAFLCLTRLLSAGGGASVLADRTIPGVGFVGDQLIDLSRLLSPSTVLLQEAFGGFPFGETISVLIPALSGVVAGCWLVTAAPPGPRHSSAIVIALGWIPLAGISFLVSAAAERYAMVSVATLLVLTAWGIWLIRPRLQDRRTAGWVIRGATVAALIGLLLTRDL
ncbi:MAG: hypothetical protein ACR2J8_08545, partial [Thermomicrobiales bacterium]